MSDSLDNQCLFLYVITNCDGFISLFCMFEVALGIPEIIGTSAAKIFFWPPYYR